MAGGWVASAKIVIFETDGIVNTAASATQASVGRRGHHTCVQHHPISLYPANTNSSEYPGSSGSPDYNTYAIIDQLKADFERRKPFRLYALGFGRSTVPRPDYEGNDHAGTDAVNGHTDLNGNAGHAGQ